MRRHFSAAIRSKRTWKLEKFSKMSVVQGASVSYIGQFDDYLDSEYHRHVPHFLEVIKTEETDDFMAWKMGHVPVKARGFFSKSNISCNLHCRQTFNMQW